MRAKIALASIVVVGLSFVLSGTASADTKNCDNFMTQAEAKIWALNNPADQSNLDNDGDGVYCESLPPGGAVATGFGGLSSLSHSSPFRVPVPVPLAAGLATSGVTACLVLRRRPSALRP